MKILFNMHANHNPDFDITIGVLNPDVYITYTKNIHTGDEYMEYYRGKNYSLTSDKPSYSKVYTADSIPTKYLQNFLKLKVAYSTVSV